MAAGLRTLVHKSWRTMASIETGVVLLILVVILSAAGTIVLQRPVTTPDEMQNAYSPLALQLLDTVGLTDVFHSWWFLGLVFLVSLCIVAASIDRFPVRWRHFSRPYKFPDEGFRNALHPQKSFLVPNREADETGQETGLAAAERALQSLGYNPERVARQDHPGIFAERYRISELAVFIVHASLLLIFVGTIVDGLWGWRGTLNLNEGQSSNIVEMRDGKTRILPFSIRCDAAGQENYRDGTLKKWWSNLAVVKNGQQARTQEIAVNHPLLYGGVRIYQSNYGPSGEVEKLTLAAAPQGSSGQKRKLELAVNGVAQLDADTTVRFAEFFPGYVVRDGHVYPMSSQLQNPAAHLVVTSKTAQKDFDVWVPELDQVADNSKAPWQFQAVDLKVSHFTGLEVSHEPGQWCVWAGAVLMGIGLAFVFYVVHQRFWIVPVRDPKSGRLLLWVGGCANRNRDAFEERFNTLAESIENALNQVPGGSAGEQFVTVVGK